MRLAINITLLFLLSTSILSCAHKSRDELIIGIWEDLPGPHARGHIHLMLFFFDDHTGVFETLDGPRVTSLAAFRYRLIDEGRYIETMGKSGESTTTKIVTVSGESLALREFYGHDELRLTKVRD